MFVLTSFSLQVKLRTHQQLTWKINKLRIKKKRNIKLICSKEIQMDVFLLIASPRQLIDFYIKLFECKDTRKIINLFMWMMSLTFQRGEERGGPGTIMVELEVSNFGEQSSELLM